MGRRSYFSTSGESSWLNLFYDQLIRFAVEVHLPTLMTTTSTRRLKLLDAPCNHVRRHAATSHAHLCPDRGTPERSCTPARVSNATLALMHHSPHPFCPAGPSSAPPARACTCALLEPSGVPWANTRFRSVLAAPGVAGGDFLRYLYVQNGAVSTGPLLSCDLASFIDVFAID